MEENEVVDILKSMSDKQIQLVSYISAVGCPHRILTKSSSSDDCVDMSDCDKCWSSAIKKSIK